MAVDCSEHIESFEPLKHRYSFGTYHAVDRPDACEVNLSFDLKASGAVENVKVLESIPGCSPFEKSSIASLKNSQFKKGKDINGCTLTFHFDFEKVSD